VRIACVGGGPAGLSPHVYDALFQVAGQGTLLDALRRRVAPRLKKIDSRGQQARPGNGTTVHEHVKR